MMRGRANPYLPCNYGTLQIVINRTRGQVCLISSKTWQPITSAEEMCYTWITREDVKVDEKDGLLNLKNKAIVVYLNKMDQDPVFKKSLEGIEWEVEINDVIFAQYKDKRPPTNYKKLLEKQS